MISCLAELEGVKDTNKKENSWDKKVIIFSDGILHFKSRGPPLFVKLLKQKDFDRVIVKF
jgi:hypothetical protein